VKRLLKIFVPVVLLVGLFVVVQQLNQPEVVEGEKSITINFFVEEDGEKVEFAVATKTISSDELQTLGDVIDWMDEKEGLDFELGGSKEDTYGRFIVGIGDHVTEDMSTGPWWLYESETNKDCVEAGYCSGIDMQPVYEDDVFEFTFGYGE